MAFITNTLKDRKGNIIPNTAVYVEEKDNPGGDSGSTVTDAFGNYLISVLNSGTLYDVYVNGISTPSSSNWIGLSVSSGDVVSSFSLCDDVSWKAEHYGTAEAEACGEHKDIKVDSILFRAGAYSETTDSFYEIRVGSSTDILRIEDIGDTFWFNPKPTAGSTNLHLGIIDGDAASNSKFFFGISKDRWIDSGGGVTGGNFVLNAGTFEDDIIFNRQATFQRTTAGAVATFNLSADPSKLPVGDSFEIPTLDAQFIQKKYVDDEIIALGIPDKIEEGDTYIEVIDLGLGKIITVHDGTTQARSEAGTFAFGGDFVASTLMHLRKDSVPVELTIERTGTGASTLVVSEFSVGTTTATDFMLQAHGADAALFDSNQNLGLGIFSGINERLHIDGSIELNGYIHFNTKGVPSDPPLEEARIFLKTRNTNNNELVALIKKGGSINEVFITSPIGICRVCGTEGNLRDPYHDTIKNQTVYEFICGHKFTAVTDFVEVK